MKEAKTVKTKLRTGDEVFVISGANKGVRGEILAIDRKKGRVWVKGVNLRQRFQRPTQENPNGGVVEREAPVSLSNVQFYDKKNKSGTRIKMGTDKNGKKVRVAAKSGKEID